MISNAITSRLQEIEDSQPNVKPDIPAVLLVGGMGTRLRSVLPAAPKPLVTIGDKSFLELPMRCLFGSGLRRMECFPLLAA